MTTDTPPTSTADSGGATGPRVHGGPWRNARTLARIAGLAAVAVGLAAISSPQVGRTLDRYSVGEFAVRSIRAPYDISVVDDEATTRQRASAAAQAGVVVALDRDVAASLQRRSAAAFDALDGQLAKLEVSTANDALPPGLSARARREAEQRQQAARQAAADAALDNFEHEIGTRVPAEVSDALTDRATVAATGEAVRSLIETAYSEPVVTDLAALRRLRAGEAEPAERIAVVVIDSATRAQLRVVDDSVVRALETVRADVLTRARRSTPDLPEPVRRWAAGLVASWLRPNATPDGLASLERQRAASVAVLPVSVSFRRDQLIVGEGEPVTRQALLVLDAIRQRRLERGEWLRLAGRAGLLLSLFLVGLVVVERGRAQLAVDHRTVPYLLTSMVLAAVGFRVWMGLLGGAPGALFTVSDMALAFAFPSAATIMYARTVLPFHAASTYLAVQSLCLGIMWQFDLALVVNQLLGGAIAGHFAAACNGRQCVLRAGALAGAIVVPVAACLALAGGPSGTGVFAVLAASFLGCALSGPVALALGPLFEWMFGHVTRIRLVEMMNYEQPLLRRLTERAPGTFQHSVTMGLMMDAAARAIDADALLGRVGALFHDVGKTERPEYFVENQQGGNPHDLIDPVESARIVIAHVHDGVSLAREAGLSERVIDFVREHHGTGCVKYFLAKATAAGHPVDPAQFSYPGPRPRSRESGLLMIADQVEATARALDEPTEDNLREMVRATIERVQAEGQLDDCPLTLQDLSVAREEFVQVLLGAHHRRIKYPAAAPAGTMPPAGRGVRSSAAPKSAAAASGERRVEGFERRSG